MSREHSERTRVQIPALLHLTKLGYQYCGKLLESDGGDYSNSLNKFDSDTNILLDVFKRSFLRLNPGKEGEYLECLRQIHNLLDDDDLGKGFYNLLSSGRPYRLIDFDNVANNEFHVTAEFTCRNGDDNFRPDITLFVNGLPLCFVEVKPKNNKEGLLAEQKRMNDGRLPNRKFRRFLNITQLMIFSNNMEYDAMGGTKPVQGVFYGTNARKDIFFNCFREDNPENKPVAPYVEHFAYGDLDSRVEEQVLFDFNCSWLHTLPEYETNCQINTPTNRVLTSLCSPERLLFLLHYGIAYYHSETENEDGTYTTADEKHIMRYPQLLASLAILRQLEQGKTSGIIWHTQGSGKTALSFYLQHILRDYYSRQNIETQFYFVVDRIDLMTQATLEFEWRGLKVNTPATRDKLMEQLRQMSSHTNQAGQSEITVINIQRFKDDTEKITVPDYATKLQRIFIVDEAHRGYKPEGSFLGNLLNADKNSVKVALTGTPLLTDERQSWLIFGDYFHTYYYDKSVEDGYTLRIIREDIEKGYRERLTKIVGELEELVNRKAISKDDIFLSHKYVDELIRYIIHDMLDFRIIQGDNTLGGMIVANDGDQARIIAERFNTIQTQLNAKALEGESTDFQPCLILHNSADKETIKRQIVDFKKNRGIDILIVDKMLLTGFDAHRLKKLYLCRKMDGHTLLQALTRVNRPYHDQHYGYVVDFADIATNFENTNQRYLEELQRFNDPEQTGVETSGMNVLISKEEVAEVLADVKELLFTLPTKNREEFGDALENFSKDKLLSIRKALTNVRTLYNVARSFGDEDTKKLFRQYKDIDKLWDFLKMTQAKIDMLNFQESLQDSEDTRLTVNEALRYIDFCFAKVGEKELDFVNGDERNAIRDLLRRTVRLIGANLDTDDEMFVTLREAFRRKFSELQIHEIKDLAEFNRRRQELEDIYDGFVNLDNGNKILQEHYNGDTKFARIHKRIVERNHEHHDGKYIVSQRATEIAEFLNLVKKSLDIEVYNRSDMLNNDEYFTQKIKQVLSICCRDHGWKIPLADCNFLTERIMQQYLGEMKSGYVA